MSKAGRVLERFMGEEGDAPAAPAVNTTATLGSIPDSRTRAMVNYQGKKYKLINREGDECTLEDEVGQNIRVPVADLPR